jgi:hypothetical protein
MRYLIAILAAADASRARRDAADSDKRAGDKPAGDKRTSDKIAGDKNVARQTPNWPTDGGSAQVPGPSGRTLGVQADPAAATRTSSPRTDASDPFPKTGA